jgi:hypothetical protein
VLGASWNDGVRIEACPAGGGTWMRSRAMPKSGIPTEPVLERI